MGLKVQEPEASRLECLGRFVVDLPDAAALISPGK